MKFLQRLVIYLCQVSPMFNKMGKITYRIDYYFIKLLLLWRIPDSEVWTRNSVQSKDIVPGLSDIDISIIHNGMNEPLFLHEYIKLLKIFFPLLGEVNFYQKKSLPIISSTINPIELDRDPKLKSRLGLIRNITNVDEYVYLLRILESDKANLIERPNLRVKKWNRISSIIDIKFNDINFADINNAIQNFIGLDNTFDLEFINPHRWLESHWSEIDEVKDKISSLNNRAKMILVGQIKWEVCGITTQLPFLANRNEMKFHFSNLEKLLSYTDIEDAQEVIKLINKAKQLV